jgi:vacuolar-type H+-ATPase subunit H
MREKKAQDQAPQQPQVEPHARVEDIHAMYERAAHHRSLKEQHGAEAVHTVNSARAQADDFVRNAQAQAEERVRRARQEADDHVRKVQQEAAELVRGAQEQAALRVGQAEEQAAAQRADRDVEDGREQYWVELAAVEAVKAGLPTTLPAELAPGALTETRSDIPTVENGGPA